MEIGNEFIAKKGTNMQIRYIFFWGNYVIFRVTFW